MRIRQGYRAGLGIAGIVAGGALVAAPAFTPPASADGAPAAYGAAAMGKAIHQNYNAVASLDPALAATRATAQVDPAASPPVQLSSYGYTNDPGTLAGAVLFAPGNPTTTSNFPGLAEAFFPVPDQEHVAKCVANNDATNKAGSAACDQSRTNTQYSLADVQPKNPLGPSAEGFASAAGTTLGNGVPLVANHVTSQSLIVPDKSGRLTVLQENKGTNITLPGTPVQIASFEASSHLVSTAAAVTGDATCTIDVVIAGQHVPVSQVQAALSALPKVPGAPLVFAFTAPTKPVVATDAIGGAASCTGAVLEISNPTTGSSVTYTFGETDARAARLGQTLAPGGTSSAPSSGSTDLSATSLSAPPPAAPPAADQPSEPATPAEQSAPASDAVPSTPSVSSPPSTTPSGAPQVAMGTRSRPRRLVVHKRTFVPIAAVTAVGASSIGLGAWALVGAVTAMAAAGGRRLSGS